MNEKFDKNAKVQQLTKVVLSHGEETGLIVKDPLDLTVKGQPSYDVRVALVFLSGYSNTFRSVLLPALYKYSI